MRGEVEGKVSRIQSTKAVHSRGVLSSSENADWPPDCKWQVAPGRARPCRRATRRQGSPPDSLREPTTWMSSKQTNLRLSQ